MRDGLALSGGMKKEMMNDKARLSLSLSLRPTTVNTLFLNGLSRPFLLHFSWIPFLPLIIGKGIQDK